VSKEKVISYRLGRTTENLSATPLKTNYSFVSIHCRGIREHDPDRSKAMALFEKYSKPPEGK